MVKLALIGVGAWGRNLYRTFLDMRNVDFAVCCDTDPDGPPQRLNGMRRVELSTDPDVIFEDPSIDAVVIASPAVTHFDLARRAIESGKDVLVEKPMTLDLAAAQRLVDLAEERGRIVMVGHLLEYHPAVEKMKHMLDSNDFGDIYYAYSERTNLGRIRSDENAMWSLAPHDISIILYLLGEEPVEVTAHGAAYIQPGIEDVVFLVMRFAGNRLAQVHVSWLDPHKVRRTTLVGSKKMVIFDDMEPAEKIRVYDKGIELNGTCVGYAESFTLRFGEVTVPALEMREPLRVECEHFLECIVSRTTPRSDGLDGLRVLKVLDAAQRSLASGGAPIRIG